MDEDDDPIGMWPVVIGGAILVVVLICLILIMVMNSDAPTP